MEESDAFLRQLTDALARRRQWLEGTQIPRLKEAFAAYQVQFESAMITLIKKGLLREDPYNYEQPIADITIPADDPLPEFESTDETSYRLAAFQRQLKHIAEQDFSLSALPLARLKKLTALLSYINWLEFAENSTSPTTRSFARVFMKVLLGPDPMSAQILKDQQNRLVKTFNQGRSIIADIVGWHRESWKADVRRTLLPRFEPELGEGPAKKEEVLHAMHKAFTEDMEGRPWYPALAQELIAEEVEVDGASRKEKILASLVIPAPAPTPAEKGPAREGKPLLMEALRILSRPHEELVTAVESLMETEKLLLPRRRGLREALRRLFGLAPREKPEAHTYEIQYSEPVTGGTHTEKISFPRLAEETRRKATLFAAIAAGTGPAYKRLEVTPERTLAAFLDRQLNELLLIHRRLTSFNALFQSRAAQSGKQGVRGIKLELLTIRNSIVKANQRRHEYGERAEAEKQKRDGAPVSAAETSPA